MAATTVSVYANEAPPRLRLVQPRLDLDSLAAGWQVALDAADSAIAASIPSLKGQEVGARHERLRLERQATAAELRRFARVTRTPEIPWLSPVPLTPALLGLPPHVEACIFDLEGVLTDSSQLQASAWAHVFDELLVRFSQKAGWEFLPFDRGADYRRYLEGRPRLEGVHAFLASRGIRLPEGRPDDPPHADTAQALARHKRELIAHGLRRRGVNAIPGARRYLQAVGHAGLGRAVVSASTSTLPMLELAGLAGLVETRVDAEAFRTEHLRSRPAPDLPLSACRGLGVEAEQAVSLTHSPAGVAAAHAVGMHVIGVGDEATQELLAGFGADRVAPSLTSLLAQPLRADSPQIEPGAPGGLPQVRTPGSVSTTSARAAAI
jgi:HAD superfamily hydrolase (TIGR01509 family)